MFPRPLDEGSSSASPQALRSSDTRKEAERLSESLYQFHRPEGKPSMQIIFIHGLFSRGTVDVHVSTWETEDGSCVWPQEWLVEEFPLAHILSVSYSGGVGKRISSQGRADMYIVAENLMYDLMKEGIGQIADCPVVLVGHCFGGLVIKQLCLEASKFIWSSRESEAVKMRKTFLENVRGIFHYGTPHHGIPFRDKEADVLDSPLLKHFKVLSEEAGRLSYEFDQLKGSYPNWRIYGLGESLPTNSDLFLDVVAVPEASAREGECFNIVEADHISISKPATKSDRRFYALKELLHNIAKNVEEEARIREETPIQEARPENYEHLPKQMIDMYSEVQVIVSKLETIRILGLVGVGGLGKTTLAMAVFNELSPKYDYSCIVPDVKLITGRVDNVKKALLECLHFRGKKVGGETHLPLLRGKRLLLVLDDISDRDCKILSDLAGDTDSESRFIVTCREQDLLKGLGEIYQVPFLNKNHAKLLFIKHAFPKPTIPPSELESLLEDIVKKFDGLPLALEVLGKYLQRKENHEVWEQTLVALEKAEDVRNLNQKLWAKLRPSYEGLGEKEQQIFLDATNFFSGNDNWTLREAKAAWTAAHQTGCELHWQTLVDMSLVHDVKEDDVIKVHEQLQSLGKMIASEPNNRGKYQVWSANNSSTMLQAIDVLELKEIHALRLLCNGKAIRMPSVVFRKLKKLRYLEVNTWVTIVGAKEDVVLPTKLVLLKCFGEALFDPAVQHQLFVLKVCRLKSLSSSIRQLSGLKHLKIGSWETPLRFLPKFFGELCSLTYLQICCSMRNLPKSFGQLRALRHLKFFDCKSLQSLPESFGQLGDLLHLQFDRCSSLKQLPESFGQLSTLTYLRFHKCEELHALPESFGQLSSLNNLYLEAWELHSLSQSFGELSALSRLEFIKCYNLKFLPECFGQLCTLKHLSFYCCKIRSLPESVGQLCTLTHLSIFCCDYFDSLPETFGKLSSLSHLYLFPGHFRTPPDSVGQLTKLQFLSLGVSMEMLPNTLGNLIDLRYLQISSGSATRVRDPVSHSVLDRLPPLCVLELCAT